MSELAHSLSRENINNLAFLLNIHALGTVFIR